MYLEKIFFILNNNFHELVSKIFLGTGLIVELDFSISSSFWFISDLTIIFRLNNKILIIFFFFIDTITIVVNLTIFNFII